MRTPPAWRSAARSVARNGANPPADQRPRREAGKAPVLAARIEQIRWRTDRQLPANTSCWRLHAWLPSGPCRLQDRQSDRCASRRPAPDSARCERAIGQPLQEAVEPHFRLRATPRTRATAGLAGSRKSIGQRANRRHSIAVLNRMQRLEDRCVASAVRRRRRGNCAKSARNGLSAGHAMKCSNRGRNSRSFNTRGAGPIDEGTVSSVRGASLRPYSARPTLVGHVRHRTPRRSMQTTD